MPGLMDLFGGGAANPYGDLISPEQQQALARQQLLNFGLSMLANSTGQAGGPRPGLGQIVGASALQAQKGYQSGIEDILQAQALKQKILESQQKTDLVKARQAIINGGVGGTTSLPQVEPPTDAESTATDAESTATGAPAAAPTQGFGAPAAGNTTYTALMGKAREFESKARQLEQIGDFETANTYYQRANNYYTQANQYQPDYGQPVAITGADGKPRMVRFDKRGGQMEVGGVAPEITQVNAGGQILLYDKNNPSAGPLVTVPVTSTPGQIAEAADRAARLAFDKQKFGAEQAAGTVVTTGDGIYRVPKNPNLPAAPVMGADKKPLQPKMQAVPQAVVEQSMEVGSSIQKVNTALNLLDTDQGKNSVGAMANLPDFMLNRMDPEGVNTRAAINDVASSMIKLLSGATVTNAESERLSKFIPTATDTPAVAKSKLKRLAQELEAKDSFLRNSFNPSRGYQELPKFSLQPSSDLSSVRSVTEDK